ncbi:hypothetical protein [uncultured Campylobacter sp.]|uniref:hypothetical protein n=1 Tax=uncultured Campylobacter sp. TaxID=218934 RepID=UPI0026241801|nr:hypothetical protein [uncultured Campylobacter sp.]
MITAKIKRRGDIWYFDDYFKSLRKNENEIAKPIRQFVSDPKRYLFSMKETLHDAVLTEFKFAILKNEDKLTMKFLSPYRDRNFKFVFKNVLAVRFKTEDKSFKNNDLIVHQFSLKPRGVCEYDFIFASEQRITVKFKQLEIIEEFL